MSSAEPEHVSQSDTHKAEHTVMVAAPAREVFELIADVGNWPRIFPPTVHVDYVEREESEERIRIWATAIGEPKGWTSRRYLDRDRLRIRFRQEVSQPPVAAMGGEWVIEALPGNETMVRLRHDFRAVGDDPVNVAWIQQAIDRNSDAELLALKIAAEQRGECADLVLSFDDAVRVAGAAKDVYEFIHQAQHWRQRLPHVARVVLGEETPNVQMLEMDTTTADGSVHTTESVRICFPYDRIIYKQLRTPALMSVHTGQWLIRQEPGGTVITSTHTVVIEPAAITRVLGAQAGVAEARTFVREALGRNSATTMGYAKAHAEQRAAAHA